jgi:hypothetical protein
VLAGIKPGRKKVRAKLAQRRNAGKLLVGHIRL